MLLYSAFYREYVYCIADQFIQYIQHLNRVSLRVRMSAVCGKNWVDKMSNSHVLCRQLGLGHALEHWLHGSKEEDDLFLYTDMDCNGTEDKLRLCNHKFTTDDTCNGKSVPWVVCSGECVESVECMRRVHGVKEVE